MKRSTIMTVALFATFLATPAFAQERYSNSQNDFFSFFQPQPQPARHTRGCDATCEERSMGYNIGADPVHPDIGPQTDN